MVELDPPVEELELEKELDPPVEEELPPDAPPPQLYQKPPLPPSLRKSRGGFR